MTMFRKVLTASVVAIALASVPAHLAAQEGPTRAADRVSVLDWFSGIWNEVATWLGGPEVPPPPTTQGSCAVDPNGGCPDNG